MEIFSIVKILIVEDEVLIGIQIKTELRRAGYQVIGPVTSGEEAIQHARTEKPDVILMDIRLMGNMDGIEAAREIHAFSSPDIIFTTGYQDVAIKERAMALHPLAYLGKPLSARHIDAVLQKKRSI